MRNGLPIQHVAKLNNTSLKMIERHYAKYISTALEDLLSCALQTGARFAQAKRMRVSDAQWKEATLDGTTFLPQ
ncbi:hypothetical protein XH88_17850 [Bradyrhizobium sp. CCBAU 51627]|nr:hypothetical protein [Bradyrhizobium sp. CCBAU 51627]